MKKDKKIIIVGAGPGGLTAGMLLSSKGFDVEIYEKEGEVGGRNGCLGNDQYKFDIGPTFLMLKPVLDEIFEEAGEDINKHLTFYNLDPMYNLVFKDKAIKISKDHEKTINEIKKHFPGEEKGFIDLLKNEKDRFETAYPCLQKDYSKFYKLFNKDLLKFLTKLSFPNSMHDELSKYFKDEDLKMSFTFQSKYLGMSPWECPAAFMIIPYIEHNFGIYHVRGGLTEISQAMKNIFIKNGGKLYLKNEVKNVDKKCITLSDGKIVEADKIIVNADVGYAMKNILKKKDIGNKDFSCSTFMMYLGIDTEIDLDFHNIFFSDDYKTYVDSIFNDKKISDDFSIYLRNASIIDDTLAPKGHSNIYILIPVPNNKSSIDWSKIKYDFRGKALEKIKNKTGLDMEKHIKFEHIITPNDWENTYNVFLGATFNLSHKLSQMLYFRPHNQLSKSLYLVGGGTHPGSGLPTIYESGRIVSKLISSEK